MEPGTTAPAERLSLEAALHDYGERFRIPGVRAEEHQPHLRLMASFCHVNVSAVMRWYRRGEYPRGDGHVRLRCLLELAGYRVDEYERVGIYAQQLGRLVSYGVIASFEDLGQRLGYRNTQSLYRVLLPGEGLSGDRVRQLNAVLRAESPKLSTYQRRWREDEEVAQLLAEIGLEPSFVTIPDNELPPAGIAPPPKAQRAQQQAEPPRPPRAEPMLSLPGQVTVPNALLVNLLVACLGQLDHVLDLIRESNDPDALAHALREQYGAGALEQIVAKIQLLA